ncbi:MAG: 1,4-dihydroxy-2-naphthoate octaprenyltransferase [Bacteroidota bacterium]
MPSSLIKTWFRATRFPSTALALNSITLGTALAIWERQWHLPTYLLAASTAITLQIIANLANDYGDSLRGANVGAYVHLHPTPRDGSINLQQLRKAIGVSSCIALLSGAALLYVSCLSYTAWLTFAALGLVAIAAAITYTVGPRPYGYAGWGDLAVLLFFGGIGVLGTVYLHAHQWRWTYALPAMGYGCLATAVLNLNNIRDLALDKQIDKKTLAVRMGRWGAIAYQWLLLGLAVLLTVLFTVQHYSTVWQWLFMAIVPALLQSGVLTMRLGSSIELNGALERLGIAISLFVALFSAGLVVA